MSLLIPEVDEIHQMDNISDRPTVEVHVYGNDLRGLQRSRYNLETGEGAALRDDAVRQLLVTPMRAEWP